MSECNAYLVETIPTGMESLGGIKSVKYTKNVLIDLTNKAKETIDLTAMYWTLKPDPGRSDEIGFTKEQLLEMGGDYGISLFNALENAAKRGVKIRILQGTGFGNAEENGESTELAVYKDQVEINQIDMNDWYDGGTMHQKFWVFDNKDIYLGSANMDWRSLTQVKELGIVLENQPHFVKDLTRYFNGWWHIASIETPKIESVYDPAYGFNRTVPAWSLLVPEEKRVTSPLEEEIFKIHYDMENPMPLMLNGIQTEAFITGCPMEFCAPGCTYDGDALVQTILESRESVCISVMDIAPVSLYRGQYDPTTGKVVIDGKTATTAWWPVLFNALVRAVISNEVHVRLLVSKWKHTRPIIESYLRALKETVSAGLSNYSTACGSLEVRLFYVPGWHSTVGPNRLYPGHTRVNHAKYIVTDQRMNIGTSNMSCDYFLNTAGTSFNSNHPHLVKKLQEIFNRDWASEYSYPF